MASADNQIQEETPAERIVSVNDYGGGRTAKHGRLIWAVLVLALAAVGAAMAVNNWRRHIFSKAPTTAQQASDSNAPELRPVVRHKFDMEPAAGTGTGAGTSARPSATTTPPSAMAGLACSDGSAGAIMVSKDGTPLLAPTGLPLRLCPNGQILLPPLPAPPSAAEQKVSAYGQSMPGTGAGLPPPAQLPSSRYGGDIRLPQTRSARPGDVQPAGDPTLSAYAPVNGQTAVVGEPSQERAHATEPQRVQPSTVLHATSATAVQASLLGNRDLILPEGRTIDCNLSLRVVTEVSGTAVCVLSSYVYGDSGLVALAEPGSVATGDYMALTAQGQRRVFIVWNRLKTTKGVTVKIASPAADALGTAGLDGYVDNRWAERIGAAVLLSTVQDAIAYQTSRAGNNGGNSATGIAIFPQTAQTGNRLAERILDSTINIRPTIYLHQGDRASIAVARDLDFGSVYVLRTR